MKRDSDPRRGAAMTARQPLLDQRNLAVGELRGREGRGKILLARFAGSGSCRDPLRDKARELPRDYGARMFRQQRPCKLAVFPKMLQRRCEPWIGNRSNAARRERRQQGNKRLRKNVVAIVLIKVERPTFASRAMSAAVIEL